MCLCFEAVDYKFNEIIARVNALIRISNVESFFTNNTNKITVSSQVNQYFVYQT